MQININKRDYYFDTLKGVLIIAVIIGNILELAAPQNVDLHFFILFLYMFHMPLFTFVSGYFSKKSNRTTVQKVKSIFLTYIFAQILYVAYSNFFLHLDYDLTLLYTHWTFWYLLSLTFWYIISDYIKNPKLWLIGSILFSLIIGFDNSVGSSASFSRTFFFLPFFIAGTMFKREYVDWLKKRRIYFLIPSIIILIILYTLRHYTPVDLLFEYTNYETFQSLGLFPLFMRAFHYIGAFFLSGFILTLIPEKKYYISNLGKISLWVYLVHGSVAHTILPYLNFNNYLNSFLSAIATVLVSILVGKAFLKAEQLIKNANNELKDIHST
ncbi:acyltransferase family protein [uncultured Clostridium sp.]|uniref:acyltransferase family protein n=1 Tax=uncultured Clostridium sp. TaxID=59620 RepID=UPI002631CEAE|nr:acyltransferase family protein [uncultured Clostridium sp.]